MANRSGDPCTTFSTIVLFTVAFNIVLALTSILSSLLFGTPITPIDRVWDYRETHFRSIPGFKSSFITLLTSLLCVPLSVVIVKRAKLVLDYVLTVQGVHVLCTVLYSGEVPRTGAWWVTWLGGCAVMVLAGEWACMRQELEPIYFGLGSGDGGDDDGGGGPPASAPVLPVYETAGSGGRKSLSLGLSKGGKGEHARASMAESRGQSLGERPDDFEME